MLKIRTLHVTLTHLTITTDSFHNCTLETHYLPGIMNCRDTGVYNKNNNNNINNKIQTQTDDKENLRQY